MSMPLQYSPEPLDSSTGYVMLLMDDLKLLIPQAQIIAMESTSKIDADGTKDQDLLVGSIRFENSSWPIYAFDNKLMPLASAPLNRQFCVLLQTDRHSFGVLSEQALLLNPGEIQSQPIPESMALKETPLIALAILAGEVICISSAERLAGLLPLNATSKPG